MSGYSIGYTNTMYKPRPASKNCEYCNTTNNVQYKCCISFLDVFERNNMRWICESCFDTEFEKKMKEKDDQYEMIKKTEEYMNMTQQQEPCKRCRSTLNVKYRACPYALDVYDKVVFDWTCGSCYNAACEDI